MRERGSYFLDDVDPLNFRRWLGSLLRRTAALLDDPEAAKLAHFATVATLHPQAKLYPGCTVSNPSKDPAHISIGANSHIRGQLLLFRRSGRISIGEWCYLGDGSRIWSRGSVQIGNHVSISHLVDIFDTNCHPLAVDEHRRDLEAILGRNEDVPELTVEDAPVVLEDGVRVGCKATILKGVRIGRGAFVAANSVVTQDVPPLCVVAGNPARVVKQIPEKQNAV